jgi:hypothetical protein
MVPNLEGTCCVCPVNKSQSRVRFVKQRSCRFGKGLVVRVGQSADVRKALEPFFRPMRGGKTCQL